MLEGPQLPLKDPCCPCVEDSGTGTTSRSDTSASPPPLASKPRLCDAETEAGAGSEPCTLLFSDLPDVADGLGAACGDPWLLGRLSIAAPDLRNVIGSRAFAVRRAAELRARGLSEWAGDCASLEQLAIGLDVESMCSAHTKNHLYFAYGGGTDVQPITRRLLSSAAKITRRHPRIRVHVDSHTGAAAPSGIAQGVSQRRAEAVVEELVTRGVEASKLSHTAWGRRVSSRWSEPENETAARAELYFRIDGLEFPRRPAYYGLVPEDKRPAEGGDAASSSDDEGPAHTRLFHRLGLRLRDGQFMSIMALLQERRSLVQESGSSSDEPEEGPPSPETPVALPVERREEQGASDAQAAGTVEPGSDGGVLL